MKALVLSGGRGTRLRPLTFTCTKQLIPIANKPILGYVLDQVALAGLKTVGIIIAPKTGQGVKDYVNDGSHWGFKVQYILQEPLGVAHAIKTAQPFLEQDPFVMYLGDNIIGQGLDVFIKKFKKENLDALIILKEVKKPSDFGIAQLNTEGHLLKVTEKPKKPTSNLAITGICIFSRKIHLAIERIQPSRRGELELTDAIQEMINMGFAVKAELLNTWWIDTGKKANLIDANAKILETYLQPDIKGILTNSTVNGCVKIDSSTTITNSTLQGPCIIGKHVTITNSSIGPHVSIGDNTYILNSNIQNSIIQENTTIKNIKHLKNTLSEKNTNLTSKTTL